METSTNQKAIFSKGERAPAEYFTGRAWVKILIPPPPALNVSVANVVFEPGSRNHWHSHKGGQILVCIDGEGYFQEKGNPIQLLREGDTVQILPGVVHWHGATPHGEFAHLAIGPGANLGVPDWLEPVTDEEYSSFKKVSDPNRHF